MDDIAKQQALSAIRTLLAIAGGSLVTKGLVDAATLQAVVGAIVTLIPFVWGIVDKITSEQKSREREHVAVNAGITAGASGQATGPVSPSGAAEVIKSFTPPTIEGTKP